VTAWPETSVSFFGGLSVGERDRRLLALREALFGARFEAVANCPACGLRLETEFDVTDVRVPDQSEARESDELCVQAGDYEVHCRLPTSDDFLAIVRLADCKTMSGQRMALLQRCIRSYTKSAPAGSSQLDLRTDGEVGPAGGRFLGALLSRVPKQLFDSVRHSLLPVERDR
jgi:hypothetical protein